MWIYSDKLCSSRATHSGKTFIQALEDSGYEPYQGLNQISLPPPPKKKNSALNRELPFYGHLGCCRRKYIRHVRWWVSACKVRRHAFSVRDKSAARVSGNERQKKIGKYDGAISCQLIARWFWFVIWQTSAVGIAGTTLSLMLPPSGNTKFRVNKPILRWKASIIGKAFPRLLHTM